MFVSKYLYLQFAYFTYLSNMIYFVIPDYLKIPYSIDIKS